MDIDKLVERFGELVEGFKNIKEIGDAEKEHKADPSDWINPNFKNIELIAMLDSFELVEKIPTEPDFNTVLLYRLIDTAMQNAREAHDRAKEDPWHTARYLLLVRDLYASLNPEGKEIAPGYKHKFVIPEKEQVDKINNNYIVGYVGSPDCQYCFQNLMLADVYGLELGLEKDIKRKNRKLFGTVPFSHELDIEDNVEFYKHSKRYNEPIPNWENQSFINIITRNEPINMHWKNGGIPAFFIYKEEFRQELETEATNTIPKYMERKNDIQDIIHKFGD